MKIIDCATLWLTVFILKNRDSTHTHIHIQCEVADNKVSVIS